MTSHTDSGPASHASHSKTLREQYKSPNCAHGATPTTMFTYIAHDKKHLDHQFHSFMLSCQTTHMEEPDKETLKNMQSIATDALAHKYNESASEINVEIEANGITLGSASTKDSASELARRRMASNCAPTYSLNNVTSHNRFTCRYLGKGLDDKGKWVQNPFQTWKGVLPSCDRTFKIGDDVVEDVKKYVWEAAGGEEAKLNVDEFSCSIHSIPIQ